MRARWSSSLKHASGSTQDALRHPQGLQLCSGLVRDQGLSECPMWSETHSAGEFKQLTPACSRCRLESQSCSAEHTCSTGGFAGTVGTTDEISADCSG